MARVAYRSVLIAVSFGMLVWAGSVRAGDDDDAMKDLLAECGGAGIAPSDINGCIERAREIDETSPSPQLQSLLANLERQAENADGDDTPLPPVDGDVASPAPANAASSQDDPPTKPLPAPKN